MPPRADGHTSPRADGHTSPRADDHVPPRADDHVPPRVDDHVPPRVDDHASPRADDHVPPRVDDHVPPRADGHVPPRVDDHVPPRVDGRPPLRRPPRSLGSFVAGFKSIVTKRINQLRDTPGTPVWQRNYYEHIIRNERALSAIRQYIIENPQRWYLDYYNANAIGSDPQARAIWRLMQETVQAEDRRKVQS